jgi:hypothetical protein
MAACPSTPPRAFAALEPTPATKVSRVPRRVSFASAHASIFPQAAAAIAAFSLDSPSKSLAATDALPIVDDRRRSVSPETESSEQTETEDQPQASSSKTVVPVPTASTVDRTRFIGDVDLPESTSYLSLFISDATLTSSCRHGASLD